MGIPHGGPRSGSGAWEGGGRRPPLSSAPCSSFPVAKGVTQRVPGLAGRRARPSGPDAGAVRRPGPPGGLFVVEDPRVPRVLDVPF